VVNAVFQEVGTLDGMEDTGRSAPSFGLLAAALGLTMAGGVVGLVAEFADLPGWLGLAGATAFFVGTATAIRLAFQSSRRDGTSLVRSLVRAVRFGFGWVFDFMP